MFFKLESGKVVNLDNVAYYHTTHIVFTAVESNDDYMGIPISLKDYERLNDLLLTYYPSLLASYELDSKEEPDNANAHVIIDGMHGELKTFP